MKDTKKVVEAREQLRLAIIEQNKKRDEKREERISKVVGKCFFYREDFGKRTSIYVNVVGEKRGLISVDVVKVGDTNVCLRSINYILANIETMLKSSKIITKSRFDKVKNQVTLSISLLNTLNPE